MIWVGLIATALVMILVILFGWVGLLAWAIIAMIAMYVLMSLPMGGGDDLP